MDWQAEVFYQCWQRMTAPEPTPEPEPSAWSVEKASNRLAKKLAQIEAGTLLPRELTTLREVTQELREAIGLKSKERAASLIEQLERSWGQVNKLQLRTFAEGGNMPLLELCAAALNEAQRVMSQALGLVNSLGSTRS